MKIAFGVLCLVSAASAMAYPYAFAYPYPVGFGHHGFGVGVEKHVGISHVGIKPWLKLGVGYGMLKPALIGYGLGVATGVGGGVAAGVGITKGKKSFTIKLCS